MILIIPARSKENYFHILWCHHVDINEKIPGIDQVSSALIFLHLNWQLVQCFWEIHDVTNRFLINVAVLRQILSGMRSGNC